MLCAFVLNLVLNQVLRVLYMLENRKRDRALDGKTEEEIEALRQESRVQGFEDVTDHDNVSHYSSALIYGYCYVFTGG